MKTTEIRELSVKEIDERIENEKSSQFQAENEPCHFSAG